MPPAIKADGPLVLQTPAPLQIARACRNGLIPSASFETDLVGSINHAAAVRTKQLFSWGCPLTAIPDAVASTRIRWRFAAHTSPMLRRIRALVYMAGQNIGGGVSPVGGDPSVTLTITSMDGSTTHGSGAAHFGLSQLGSSDVPSNFGYFEIVVSGVPADSDIAGYFTDGYGRLISAVVYEESQPIASANGYIMPASVSVQGPIYGNRRKRALELATSLWKHGAAPLWNWTVDDQSSPVTVTNDAKNIIGGGVPFVGVSAAGATLDTRYCRTRSKATVPCVFAAYAKVGGAGDDGFILLVDEGGNTVAAIDVSGETTPGWFTTAVDLPATLARYFLFAASNTGTLSVGAVSLYQYAA